MTGYAAIDLNIFMSLILFIIIVMIQHKQTYRTYSSRLFLLLCWSTITILLLDAVFWLINGTSRWAVYIITVAYYLMEPLPLLVWVCYLDYHLFSSVERLRRRWYYVQPLIFILLLMVINVFTGFVFSVDSRNEYQRGPGIPLVLSMNIVILLATIFFALRHWKRLEKRIFSVIVMFGIVPIIGGVLQVLTYGVSILWNSVALSVIIIYLFLETQKEIRDYLTGLLNRQQIDDLIIARMVDYEKKGSFTVIMLDMDDFKIINDTYGHKEGDRALIRLSEILYGSVKNIDKVARFGGDEFLILLEETESHRIDQVISRIQHLLDEENKTNGRPYRLAVSSGYSVYSPQKHGNFQELLNSADQEMYSTKMLKK